MSDTIRRRVTVPANGVVDNAIAGDLYEFLGSPSRVEGGIVADTADAVTFDLNIGSRAVAKGAPAPVEQSAGRGVNARDDVYLSAAGLQGDRITVLLRNGTGGAVVADILLLITPLSV